MHGLRVLRTPFSQRLQPASITAPTRVDGRDKGRNRDAKARQALAQAVVMIAYGRSVEGDEHLPAP